jgi:phage-related baseplate assembly protein
MSEEAIPMDSVTVDALPAETRALVLDLVAWVAAEPRPYEAVMAAWRTSCPRLTVWEDAVDQGLVARRHANNGAGAVVVATERGRALLRAAGRRPEGGVS